MLLTLDTNVLYQVLMSNTGASHWILKQVREGTFHIALSIPVFQEYYDVLTRAHSLNDFGLHTEDVEKFLRFVAYVGKTYHIFFLFRPNLQDEKDNMLVELAITSQSDYLVTNNIRDFKKAELKFDQLNIITPGDFVQKWRKRHG